MKIFKKINWVFCSQFGIDIRKFLLSIIGIPKYVRDLSKFKKIYSGRLEIRPCLSDWNAEAGALKDEYFWQDLFVAQKIFKANPLIHVDIGSRIDGFVAHIASFRDVEVFDIRDIKLQIPRVSFSQIDFMNSKFINTDYCDSLSCLHALEHFGLGRYGDPLDLNGYIKGLSNMSKILKSNGIFYLSVPVGIEKIEFNAHRIFDPLKLYLTIKSMNFILEEFTWIDNSNIMHQFDDFNYVFNILKNQHYNLGIFVFRKSY